MTDPCSGWDGTQAITGPDGADALAPPPRAAGDDAMLPSDSVALSAVPALPSLPVAADPAAVARWMDVDAEESRRTSDRAPAPPARGPWVDGETVEVGETRPGVVRDAGPARVLPREASPAPRPAPAFRAAPPSRRPLPDRPAAAPRDEEGGGEGDEPVWLRERREEHEFRSQFGEWRAASSPPPRAGGLSPTTLLVVLVVVAILVLMALG